MARDVQAHGPLLYRLETGIDTQILMLGAGGLLVALGLAGLLIPLLPGAPLMLAGFVLLAWAEGFAHVGTGTLVLLAVLALLTYAADIIAGALGARRFGASRRAMAGAAIGAVLGLFAGLVGVLVGPFVGAVAGALSDRQGIAAAGRSGVGATVGLLVGAVAKLALGLAMIGVFAVARFL